jgi:hypothetical protein
VDNLSVKVSSQTEDKEKGRAVTRRQWAVLTVGAVLIAGVDIALLVLAQVFNQFAWTFAGIGVVTFIGMLATANYASETFELKGGEMRAAIAASTVIMYLVLVSFFTFSTGDVTPSSIPSTVIQHFTYVVEIVIIFYFGSKAVTESIKKLKG